MRIATYNLWNSAVDWERRVAAAADELRAIKADVIALQEAPSMAASGLSLASYLEAETGFRYALHLPYPVESESGDRPEGLAFLSDTPMRGIRTNWESSASTQNNWAARVTVELSGKTFGITDVHLDWERRGVRARGIVDINENFVGGRGTDFELLCGDFNEDDDGPVAQYLQATSWRDLVTSAEKEVAPPATLDFVSNPHLRNRASERSRRFDRIYLRTAQGRPIPKVIATGLFGDRPANRFTVVPSDHYGVFVDLKF
jgi:endonuclease/exonuclease/phosphatase family metal-dependent hydrolase